MCVYVCVCLMQKLVFNENSFTVEIHLTIKLIGSFNDTKKLFERS